MAPEIIPSETQKNIIKVLKENLPKISVTKDNDVIHENCGTQTGKFVITRVILPDGTEILETRTRPMNYPKGPDNYNNEDTIYEKP